MPTGYRAGGEGGNRFATDRKSFNRTAGFSFILGRNREAGMEDVLKRAIQGGP